MNTMNFDISLCLGLGLHEQRQKKKKENPCSNSKAYQYSLTLGIGSLDNIHEKNNQVTTKIEPDASNSTSMHVSSFSNSINSIKRERDDHQVYNLEEKIPFVDFDVDENCSSSKKKLRLTKEQSTVLEDTFKDHSTLNPKKKLELAKKLNLRTRQVEVWFQNRRARTKLKQTEVNCEALKKCYETLTKENKRLEEELKELKMMKTMAEPFNHTQLPVAGITVCPSCKTICKGNSNSSVNGTFHTKVESHLYTKTNNYMFTQSSAAIAS
ncbi:homeobox-leucine zipper protein HOX15-like [Vicia villosa]|uniref:homeobox-leucine zipper protein HOX15-like n=1 Tax=Vicia villosa TaxID=3911 RepID=UPI00273C6295|nr:homeobox-leucine zipper protein HOX15-like [Vicia villosa]